MDGIIPLYKERGMTSNDCVRHCRQILKMKRIGHSGTLDPNVNGVLPLCIGRATKVVNYLMDSGKIYSGEITFGLETTTQDLDGQIIKQKALDKPLTFAEINAAMQQLTGDLIQVPPLYSAVKVNGRRLYMYARLKIPVQRPKRRIRVDYFRQSKPPEFDWKNHWQKCYFEVSCGKGTYIRTLANDLGKLLGVPAVMSQLTRKKSGGFDLSQTISLQFLKKIVQTNQMSKFIYDWDVALGKYQHYQLSEAEWQIVKNGGFLKLNLFSKQLVLTYQHKSRCIYQLDPSRSLYIPEQMIDLREENQL